MERGRGSGKVGKNEGTRERWGVGEEKNKEERRDKAEGTHRGNFFIIQREKDSVQVQL